MKEIMKHGVFAKSSQIERRVNRLRALVRKEKADKRAAFMKKLKEINMRRKSLSSLLPVFLHSTVRDWKNIQPEVDKVFQSCMRDLRSMEDQLRTGN